MSRRAVGQGGTRKTRGTAGQAGCDGCKTLYFILVVRFEPCPGSVPRWDSWGRGENRDALVMPGGMIFGFS